MVLHITELFNYLSVLRIYVAENGTCLWSEKSKLTSGVMMTISLIGRAL